MRHLQTYRLFEATQTLTREQKEFLDRYTMGTWRINPTTGEVDVDGDFDCSGRNLKSLKGIRFGKVKGDFYCNDNSLKTLEGAPTSVDGGFDCSRNSLKTLVGAPRTVGGHFYCSYNKLTTLEGAPGTVEGNFFCSYNKLTTLEGAPTSVDGDFVCPNNELTTLEGAPEKIVGKFYSDSVKLPPGSWSLEGLIGAYRGSQGESKSLLGTLVSPEALQKLIDENPEKTAVELKGVLKDPMVSGLKWPESLKREMDLLGDLSGVGL